MNLIRNLQANIEVNLTGIETHKKNWNKIKKEYV